MYPGEINLKVVYLEDDFITIVLLNNTYMIEHKPLIKAVKRVIRNRKLLEKRRHDKNKT